MADASNRFGGATKIVPRARFRVVTQTLGAGDPADHFKFRVKRTSSFDSSVLGIPQGSNFDFFLFNRQKQVVKSSTRPGNLRENIRIANLEPGLYFLRIQWQPGSTPRNRKYKLRFSMHNERAGNSIGDALELGALPAGSSFSYDYVGAADSSDIYGFDLAERTNFAATLTPFFPTASFNLLNSSGGFLGNVSPGGTTPKTLQQVLAPGKYYVAVNRGSVSSPYALQLTNNPIPDLGGNDFGTATPLNVGFQQSTFSDYVGAGDPADFFSFNAPTGGDLTLQLGNISTDFDINLYSGQGGYLNTSSLSNGIETLFIQNLPPGSYFIEVKTTNPAIGSDYTLTSLLAPPDNVGDTTTDATVLTGTTRPDPFELITATPQTYRDFASGGDDDVFRFDFTQSFNFLSINLGGLTANLDMEFFKEGTNNRIFSSRGGTTADVFEGTVGPGTYFLRIFSPNPATGSAYDLVMSADSQTSRPSIVRDVFPNGDSNASLLREVRPLSTLFFTATDGTGLGLWKTGGSLETTIQVGAFDSITDMQSLGNTLYIVGRRTGDTGTRLYKWIPSGGDQGTISQVSNVVSGVTNLAITSLTAIENSGGTSYLYFVAGPEGTPQDQRLYRTDGITTEAIANAGDTIGELTYVNNTLYYQASGAIVGGTTLASPVLWQISNPTNSTVTSQPFTSFNSGALNLQGVGALRAFGDDLYFISYESADASGSSLFNAELRRLTSTGNLITFDANNDPSTGIFENPPSTLSFALAGNYFYYTATGDTGTELYRSDITNGTTQVFNINTLSPSASSNPTNLIVYQNQLFFSATGNDNDTELYVIQTPDATALPSVTKVDLLGTGSSNPQDFRIASNKLYFVATRADGTEVYTYDGSVTTPLPITAPDSYTLAFDIAPGAASSDPEELVVVGDTSNDGSAGRIYFTANNGTSGREVWVV